MLDTERVMQDVGGVVLAAGRSRRMGRSKALLDAGSGTFLESCITALRAGGCGRVVAVVRVDEPDAARLAREAGADVIDNPDVDSEQLDSLRLALRALPPESAGAAVLPVDHPLVRPDTVAALLDRFEARRPLIVRPVHGGVAGHPTIFARDTFQELLDLSLPAGARSFIARHREEVEDVAVDDAGVTADIDTLRGYTERFGEPRDKAADPRAERPGGE